MGQGNEYLGEGCLHAGDVFSHENPTEGSRKELQALRAEMKQQ